MLQEGRKLLVDTAPEVHVLFDVDEAPRPAPTVKGAAYGSRDPAHLWPKQPGGPQSGKGPEQGMLFTRGEKGSATDRGSYTPSPVNHRLSRRKRSWQD